MPTGTSWPSGSTRSWSTRPRTSARRGWRNSGLTFTPVGNDEEVAALVQQELDRLVTDEERDPDHVVVLTFSSRVRDGLISTCGLVRWEDRANGVVCETVHRAKGLESDTVVLVSDKDDVADHLLYIGISRAVSELVVIAPPALGDRLGLMSPTMKQNGRIR